MAGRPSLAGLPRRAAANLRRALRRTVFRSGLPRRGGFWLRLRLGSALGELRLPSGFGARGGLGLLEVLQTLAAAARDPDVRGVLVELEGGLGGWSRRQALRRALVELRDAGKKVVAYAETLDTGDLFLASAATTLWIAPGGAVHLTGLRLESLFLRGLLDRLAVEADVVRVGSHKGAAEMFTRGAMSPEQREQMEGVLDDLFGVLVAAVAEGRGIAPERVRELVDEGLFPARAAQAAGLVDGTRYPDELDAALKELAPVDAEHPLEMPAYHARRVVDCGWLPLLHEPPHVAYVVARGMIRRGRGLRGIGTEAFRTLLRRIREDARVRGVVLRIESPGGDGLASDLLWRELSLLAREKPVVVSMGDVAASGGYYLAVAGSSVLAEAVTLTGSIGVVGGKVNLAGLYERLGVRRDAIERGARAGLFSEARAFTPGERSAVRSEMESVYETFVARVAEGRKLAPEAVERAAQGRVWSGARAHGLGLVDALGGPLEALREVAHRIGLGEHERVVVDVHPRLPHFAGLRAWVGLALAGWLDAGGR
jgi:protease-4